MEVSEIIASSCFCVKKQKRTFEAQKRKEREGFEYQRKRKKERKKERKNEQERNEWKKERQLFVMEFARWNVLGRVAYKHAILQC